jgi:hypothetical protein
VHAVFSTSGHTIALRCPRPSYQRGAAVYGRTTDVHIGPSYLSSSSRVITQPQGPLRKTNSLSTHVDGAWRCRGYQNLPVSRSAGGEELLGSSSARACDRAGVQSAATAQADRHQLQHSNMPSLSAVTYDRNSVFHQRVELYRGR